MKIATVVKFTDIAKVKKLADSNNVEVSFYFYQHEPVVNHPTAGQVLADASRLGRQPVPSEGSGKA